MIPTAVLRSPGMVQKVLKSFQTEGGYDMLVLPGLRVLDSEEGRVRAEFTVEKQHLNRLKSVHGGLLATVVDVGGSLALASKGMYATGVSTDINISYISGVKEGQVVNVDCRCDKLGKTLAFTSVDLSSNGRLVATGRHSKFVAQAYSHPENEIGKK
ncbi:acyl-coenzyme A thioesterase-like protein 13 [Zychaea mexicana]|uniref:acyl-coenzyme A thioesterase-like protein 13 n=1 Tax=Zychaea mexicana TaxID=64656 RepID=UPI0022FE274C|nr:acyl-coenzyme A thioesterase-like protein 13 [Zychaea mexicana]KAI9499006.1 acyl-coenzyme A thioesterase-like protein 13 [Zychaea mexicana]